MSIDLEKLEQLINEDIDLGGETLGTIGTQVMFSDGSKFAHAFAKNDDLWLARVRARIIAAACNAVPELIARVRELERQRVELAELAVYNNGCFDCPLEDVCLYKEETVRDSEVCAKLLVEWVEKTAKEAGE